MSASVVALFDRTQPLPSRRMARRIIKAKVKELASYRANAGTVWRKYLVAVIRESGIAVGDLAQRSGVGAGTIESWVSGRTHAPTLPAGQMVLRACGKPLTWS